MAASNVTPSSGSSLGYGESFTFEVTAGYASLQVKVTLAGGTLSSAYDDGADTGYTVAVVDLGATHEFTVSRDSGWSDDTMTVYVTEDGNTTSWTYDIFPTIEYPEGMQPYNDQGTTASTVTSFKSRTGAVVPVDDDYAASMVTNDSGVAGAYVDDALDQLNTDIAAIPAAPVDSVHGRTGDVVSVEGDYDADEVTLLTAGTPDINTIQELIDQHIGVGIITGGLVSDNGDGTATVTGGTGMLRGGDVDTGPVYSIEWTTDAAMVLVDDDINYIYVEWNAGAPQLVSSTTLPTDLNTNLLVAGVHRSGTVLHPTPYRYSQNNLAFQINRRHYNVDGTTHASGAAISEENTREIRVEAGEFFLGLNEALFASHNSNTDGCAYYYRDGVGGWTTVYPSTAIDNLQYDDGSGTLATLGNNRYGVHWVYISPHDQHMYFVYGQDSYTKSEAQSAVAPSSLPPQIDEWHGVLAGKVTVQKSATNLFSVESAFVKLFLSGGVDAHGDLTGLTDDDHTQYALADGTRGTFPGVRTRWTLVGAPSPDSTPNNAGEFYVSNAAPSGPGQIKFNKTEDLDGVDMTQFWTRMGQGSKVIIEDPTDPALTAWFTLTTSDDIASTHRIFECLSAGYSNGIPNFVAGTDYVVWIQPNSRTVEGLTFTEKSAPQDPDAGGSGTGYLWVKNTTPCSLFFTDDTGTDFDILNSGSGDVVGPASAADGEIPTYSTTTGKLIRADANLYNQSGELKYLHSAPSVVMAHRAAAPAATTGRGKYWVHDGATDTNPWFTGEDSIDMRLDLIPVTLTGRVSFGTTANLWYGPTRQGSYYNDVDYTSTYGTSSTPSTSSAYLVPPLIIFPEDADMRLKKATIYYNCTTNVSGQFELGTIDMQTGDSAAGLYDTLADGASNTFSTASSTKFYIQDLTIGDSALIPAASHHSSLYFFMRNTSTTSGEVNFTLTLWFQTYAVTGWDF